MRSGRAGEEFALAFENRHMLGLESFADRRDKNRSVFANVVARAFEADKQAGRKVFCGDGC